MIFSIDHAIQPFPLEIQQEAVKALESGQVVYFPKFGFELNDEERQWLTPDLLNSRSKNISHHPVKQTISGFHQKYQSHATEIASFMHRFSLIAKKLIVDLIPAYQNDLEWGRTSYRPAEIQGRQRSKRQDDTRLHVDAFPSTPVHGKRILRVFCNINPKDKPRVWNLGEPFPAVLQRFAPGITPYRRFTAKLRQTLRMTKSLRSPYDHYMLHLHDTMKLDSNYQEQVAKTQFQFPAQSLWLVYTDQVSHAALQGQYLLEQTFYLPVEAMVYPETTPYYQWQSFKKL